MWVTREVVPVHATKTCAGNRGVAPPFLTSTLHGGEDTSRLGRFKSGGKRTRYPWNKRTVGAQSRSGRFGEQKNILLQAGFEPRIAQPLRPVLYWCFSAFYKRSLSTQFEIGSGVMLRLIMLTWVHLFHDIGLFTCSKTVIYTYIYMCIYIYI